MKQAPQALQDELYLQNVHQPRDLYTLELAAGTQRWTSADVSVTTGGQTWTPAIVEGVPKEHGAQGLEVASFDVSFAADIVVGGVRLGDRARAGELHGKRLTVARAFIAAAGAVAGTATIFSGQLEEVTPSAVRVEAVAKSPAAQLVTAEIPGFFVAPECQYRIYDPNTCGVSEASFRDTRYVAATSTDTEIELNTASTRLTVGGWLHFQAGALAGKRAAVRDVLSSTRARLAYPLPSVPAIGVEVRVVRGCDRTYVTCRDVFSNLVKFSGAPFAPNPDLAVYG